MRQESSDDKPAAMEERAGVEPWVMTRVKFPAAACRQKEEVV